MCIQSNNWLPEQNRRRAANIASSTSVSDRFVNLFITLADMENIEPTIEHKYGVMPFNKKYLEYLRFNIKLSYLIISSITTGGCTVHP